MGFFTNLFKRGKNNERAVIMQLIKNLNGRQIKYVVERLPDEESDIVIGRTGALILKGDELLVYSDEKVLFRAVTNELDASELLSLEGVILSAPDIEHGRRPRTVIAYYTYYRKT